MGMAVTPLKLGGETVNTLRIRMKLIIAGFLVDPKEDKKKAGQHNDQSSYSDQVIK
jgi:hypothetical protein